jgi:hypothetical protein
MVYASEHLTFTSESTSKSTSTSKDGGELAAVLVLLAPLYIDRDGSGEEEVHTLEDMVDVEDIIDSHT